MIDHLTLADWMCCERVDLDLTGAPVHLFVGPNNAGKSAIADAIRMGLTGQCRGIRTRKTGKARGLDYASLTRSGARGYRVQLDVSTGNGTVRVVRTPTRDDLPTGLDLKTLAPVLAMALDPWQLLAAKPADRSAMLRELYGEAGPDAAAVSEAWAAWGRDVASRRPAPDGIHAIADRSVSDLAAALEQAKGQRLAVHRQRAALAVPDQGPDPIVCIYDPRADAKQPIDARRWDLPEARARRDQLLQDQGAIRDRLATNPARRQVLAAQIAELKASLEQPEAAPTNGNVPEDPAAELADLNRRIDLLNRMAGQIHPQGRGRCVVGIDRIACPHHKDARVAAIVGENIEEATLARANLEQAGDTPTAGSAPGRADLARELAAATQELAALEKVDLASLEAQADALQQRIDLGHVIIDAVAGRRKELAEYDAAIANRDELDAEHALWDEVVKLLQPGGAVHDAYNAGEADTGIDTALAQRWDCALQIGADGTVTVNGQPFELASASQQWRAGVLVADGLARKSGTGLLILDQADILGPPNREILTEFLAARRETFRRVLVFATEGDVARTPSPVPWLQKWTVADGTVTPIQPPPPTAAQ